MINSALSEGSWLALPRVGTPEEYFHQVGEVCFGHSDLVWMVGFVGTLKTVLQTALKSLNPFTSSVRVFSYCLTASRQRQYHSSCRCPPPQPRSVRRGCQGPDISFPPFSLQVGRRILKTTVLLEHESIKLATLCYSIHSIQQPLLKLGTVGIQGLVDHQSGTVAIHEVIQDC